MPVTAPSQDPAAPLAAKDEARKKLELLEEEDDEDDVDPWDEDDDEEELATFSPKQAAGALATVFRFSKPYLLRYKTGLMLVGIGVLVETAFNVIMPLSMKYLIDDALGNDNYTALVTILSVLFVAGAVTSVTAVWYERRDAQNIAKIIADVRHDLFAHIQLLPTSYFSRASRGDVLSRFSIDLAAYQDAIRHMANTGALPLFELIAGVLLMLYLSWQLALVAVFIFPIVLIGPRLITPRALAASYEQKVQEGSTLGIVQENIGAQVVVKAFGLQRRATGWFSSRNMLVRGAMSRAIFLTSMVERTVTIGVLALHLVVLAIGAWLAYNEAISVGTFVTFESAFWEISYNIAHLMNYVPVVVNASAGVRHMQDLLDEPIRVAERVDAVELPRIKNEITFEHVSFRYDGADENLMSDLNFSIPCGTRAAVVGPSGSGKSTLLNLILRLYDPTEGRVLIDGVNVADASRASLRGQMAVVFQENVLFNMSVRENIRLGNEEATDEDVERAAKAAEIHRFIKRLPHGYDTIVGERGDTLSGGQRQRIAIARAIIRDPAILLLDEATSALDQTTEVAINNTLKRVSQGRTMVFVTHRLTAVADMDEIIVMDAGRVVERGTHEQLLKKGGVYRHLWDDQQRRHHDDEDDEDDDDEA
jgi:ATP-binding cassette subfamily B protein